MRTLVIVLALTATAFAGTTVYFAHQLSIERERNAASAIAATAAAASGIRTAPAELRVDSKHPSLSATSAKDEIEAVLEGDELPEAQIRAMQSDFGKQFLAELADPQRHSELLAERKLMIRNSYPRVDRALGLTPDEYSRFIEQLARQQLDAQEADAHCMVNPECQMRVPAYERLGRPDDTSREVSELLGPTRMQKFEQYKNSMSERESVSQLRNRLSDEQRLSDASAENLIAALADERQSIYRESSPHDAEMSGIGFGFGMVFTSVESEDPDARYESARQNSQRLHDRAAQYLNPEQMRAFDEMQDETLINLRSVLRNKAVLTP